MNRGINSMNLKHVKIALLGLLTAAALSVAVPEEAQAQQIQLTGPLAGQPAVRKLRMYREGRFELAPNLSFSLLDQYRRQIFLGVRANYGVLDWLSVGVWGGVSSSFIGVDLNTGLTQDIQEVNEGRDCANNPEDQECKLTAVNLGDDFRKQVASINWIVAPQVTAVPFRGKLGLFGDIFVDADLYFFAGPAIVGIDERPNCAGNCTEQDTTAQGRTVVAPTFGLGFTFYTGRWTAVGAEWRGLPFKYNTGGFDVAGGGEDDQFPDGNISAADREFRFNQMLTLNFNMYLPMDYAVSE
jgi:hypothetical protein